MHGWGENEQGWHTQGHVDVIMDNLIAEKKAMPFIIVMDNLNAVKPGESAALYGARGALTQAVLRSRHRLRRHLEPRPRRRLREAAARRRRRWPWRRGASIAEPARSSPR